MNTQRQVRTARAGYLVSAALFGALGLALLLRPSFTVMDLHHLLGGGMLLFGAVKMVGYFSADLYGLAFQHDLAFGILLLALGLTMAVRSGGTFRTLALAVGLSILADGLLKLQTALDARSFGLDRWWLILASALAAGVGGLLLLVQPYRTRTAMEQLLGLTLVLEGVLSAVITLTAVKVDHMERR